MALSSMTGYARVDGGLGDCTWTWDVRSVNGKGLDVRCRVPNGFEQLEADSKRRASSVFGRGTVTMSLSARREALTQTAVVNRAMLDEFLSLQDDLAGRVSAEPPRLEILLQVRGLVEMAESDIDPVAAEARDKAILATLDDALQATIASRRSEGDRLHAVLEGQLDEVGALVAKIAGLAATQPDSLRARLRAQVDELLDAVPPLAEERLLQEAAVLATKADIREEIDRLGAHVEAATDLLSSDVPVGRRLEFLCQEFNREANTLCAKSSDIELTTIGLDLKAVIDQMREQVQNVE